MILVYLAELLSALPRSQCFLVVCYPREPFQPDELLTFCLTLSMVCGGRLLLRHSAVDIHLGAQHAVQGKDDYRDQSKPRIHVSLLRLWREITC